MFKGCDAVVAIDGCDAVVATDDCDVEDNVKAPPYGMQTNIQRKRSKLTYRTLLTVIKIDQEPRTVIHVKRAKCDPMG